MDKRHIVIAAIFCAISVLTSSSYLFNTDQSRHSDPTGFAAHVNAPRSMCHCCVAQFRKHSSIRKALLPYHRPLPSANHTHKCQSSSRNESCCISGKSHVCMCMGKGEGEPHLELGESRQEARAVPTLERMPYIANITRQDDTLALHGRNENMTSARSDGSTSREVGIHRRKRGYCNSSTRDNFATLDCHFKFTSTGRIPAQHTTLLSIV